MPYIKQEDRDKWCNDDIGEVAGNCECAGDLNYIFTKIAHEYLNRKGLRYQNINDVIGALEGAKLELYRCVAAPYEDQKIEQNGYVSNIDRKHHVVLYREGIDEHLGRKHIVRSGSNPDMSEDEDDVVKKGEK